MGTVTDVLREGGLAVRLGLSRATLLSSTSCLGISNSKMTTSQSISTSPL